MADSIRVAQPIRLQDLHSFSILHVVYCRILLIKNSSLPAERPVQQAVLQPLHRLPDTFQPAVHHETNQSVHNLTKEQDKNTVGYHVGHLGRLRVVCPKCQYCL